MDNHLGTCPDDETALRSKITNQIFNTNIRRIYGPICLEYINRIYSKLYSSVKIQNQINRLIIKYYFKGVLGGPINADFVEKTLTVYKEIDEKNAEKRNKRKINVKPIFQSKVAEFQTSIQKYVNMNPNNYSQSERLRIIESCYRYFFRLFMKGGAAMTFTIYAINHIIYSKKGTRPFSEKSIKEGLGELSDFDMTLIINPYIEDADWVYLWNDLCSDIVEESKTFLNMIYIDPVNIRETDNVFNSNLIESGKPRNAILSHTPSIDINFDKARFIASGFKVPAPENEKVFGHNHGISFISHPLDASFHLMRLMIGRKVKYSTPVCLFGNRLSDTMKVYGELVDISIPFLHTASRLHEGGYTFARNFAGIVKNREVVGGWKYSLSCISLHLDSCDTNGLTCSRDPDRPVPYVYIYNMGSIIEDLQMLINATREGMAPPSKMAKRQRRLEFFKKFYCYYKLLVDHEQGIIDSMDYIDYCIEDVQKLWPYTYIDEDVARYLIENVFWGIDPQDNNFVVSAIQKWFDNAQREIGESGLPINNSFRIAINNIIKLYSTVNLAKNNSYIPIIYKLLAEATSMRISFNDNFFVPYVTYLLLTVLKFIHSEGTRVPPLTPHITYSPDGYLNSTFIDVTEFMNNTVTRPFIQSIAAEFLRNLLQHDAFDNVKVKIFGGFATHLWCTGKVTSDTIIKPGSPPQTWGTQGTLGDPNFKFDGIKTNDIDLEISTPNAYYTTEKIFEYVDYYARVLNSRSLTDRNYVGKTFKPVVHRQPNGSSLVQLHMSVNLNTVPGASEKLILDQSVGFLSDFSVHHIIEIYIGTDMYQQSECYDLVDGSNSLYNGNGPRIKRGVLSIVRADLLVKNFNIMLDRKLHWYRKYKYIQRIAALNVVNMNSNEATMIQPNVRKMMDILSSEFKV